MATEPGPSLREGSNRSHHNPRVFLLAAEVGVYEVRRDLDIVVDEEQDLAASRCHSGCPCGACAGTIFAYVNRSEIFCRSPDLDLPLAVVVIVDHQDLILFPRDGLAPEFAEGPTKQKIIPIC
jgi:hypothetical protein